VVVQVKAVQPFKQPISLATIKSMPDLQNMALIKMSRLSVQPVSQDEWDMICGIGL
jgi:predicted RNA-binding protein with PUA-like domain